MKCRLCGEDTASAKYDRILDRFYVSCTECQCYVAYNHLHTKEDVIKAYESSIEKRKRK